MRTTITLDSDVRALLERRIRERGVSFKVAVNDALRAGLGAGAGPAEAYRTPTFRLGPMESERFDKALQLAGELEDEELSRRVAQRK